MSEHVVTITESPPVRQVNSTAYAVTCSACGLVLWRYTREAAEKLAAYHRERADAGRAVLVPATDAMGIEGPHGRAARRAQPTSEAGDA